MVKCVANVTEIVEVVFGAMGKGKAKKKKKPMKLFFVEKDDEEEDSLKKRVACNT